MQAHKNRARSMCLHPWPRRADDASSRQCLITKHFNCRRRGWCKRELEPNQSRRWHGAPPIRFSDSWRTSGSTSASDAPCRRALDFGQRAMRRHARPKARCSPICSVLAPSAPAYGTVAAARNGKRIGWASKHGRAACESRRLAGATCAGGLRWGSCWDATRASSLLERHSRKLRASACWRALWAPCTADCQVPNARLRGRSVSPRTGAEARGL